MALKYKVGDRVLATDNIERHTEPSPGTVIETKEWGCNYLVRYEDSGAELWSNVHSLINPKYPVIVISTDGKTTTAVKRLGKEILGKATSVCHEDDEFDYDIGAAVAFARLVGADHIATGAAAVAPKPETRKVVCIRAIGDIAKKHFTPGKVYIATHVLDETWKVESDDNGGYYAGLRSYGSFVMTWDCTRHIAEFIPLVED